MTIATTHGGLDDDFAVQEAIVRHVKDAADRGAEKRGRAKKEAPLEYRVVRPTHMAPRQSHDGDAVDGPGSIEETVVSRVVTGRAATSRPVRR